MDWAAVIGVPLTLYGLLSARTQNRAELYADKVIEDLVSASKKRWGPQRYQLLGQGHHAINLGFQVMNEPPGAPADPGQDCVDKRRILPVLDGLDEMDAGSDPHDAAPRAVAVMKALNASLDGHTGAPVVLACRSWRYRALVDSGHALAQATHIQIAPLTAGQACGYLTRRSTTSADRLAVLLDGLHASDPAAPVPWLSTPRRVTLVAAALAGGTHPRELLSHAQRGLAAADESCPGPPSVRPGVQRLETGGYRKLFAKQQLRSWWR
ncbi:hypothetical protein ACOT81_28030 [Streptomyces sp. WI04-05B]|uniref:hypothetical protein n=1 Tax=Streptomyces TaxID=1883 RepID=UPI0029B674F8|nr:MULTISPECIES: hypothetical protein [unclassified Streptomyces]MDX2546792.1 hypothetical protein [Streptomyces sp. WI04-05B]MDX2589588.1 hypothetical protein [Streptomyces sp. WI04-05A]